MIEIQQENNRYCDSDRYTEVLASSMDEGENFVLLCFALPEV